MIRGDADEAVAYRSAAALARAHHIESDAELGPLLDAPPAHVDPDVLRRLRLMYDTGGWVLVESTLADLPADLRWLYESGAVRLDVLAALHERFGVTTAADLAAVISDHSVRDLIGAGEPVEVAIAAALPRIRASIPRISLGRATALAEPLLARLREMEGVAWAESVGSLRRGRDMVGDIELIASARDGAATLDAVASGIDAARWLHRSAHRVYFFVDRVQVGIRAPEPARAAASLLYLTGAPAHVRRLRQIAAEKGWQLTATALHAPDGSIHTAPTEIDIYDALGLPFIPPEIREGDEEIDAAREGRLPVLVTRSDIRGDLHMHSTWSDGRDTVEAMVSTCRSLGYEYLAITDHSPHSAATRNLTVDSVKKQADEIAALRERFPEIAILHGCEVDILATGRLDFSDRILEKFDIVLASLHEQAGHGADGLLSRYAAAMRHPLVSLITHPTNRLVPNRPGYDMDYDRLFAIAIETNTLVEVDGSPAHLDLDGAMARRAIGAGAMMAVDSDCHRASLLDRQMRLGVITARRGWVEPQHVLNTRPLADVRAFIARKRAGR